LHYDDYISLGFLAFILTLQFPKVAIMIFSL
jgi:hypothetical protein